MQPSLLFPHQFGQKYGDSLGPTARRLAPIARITDFAFVWVYLNGWITCHYVYLAAELTMSRYLG